MKNIFLNKYTKRGFIGLGLVTSSLYATGHLEDTYYLLGGFYRGLRCAKAGSQIAYSYLKVFFVYSEWNKRRNSQICSWKTLRLLSKELWVLH